MTDQEEILIGTIVKPHGIEGAILVEVFTDFPLERFRPGQTIRVKKNHDRVKALTISSSSYHQDRLLVEVEEISDRDQAEDLREAEIVIHESEVIGREGDLYEFDLIGMEVYNQTRELIGEIKSVSGEQNHTVLDIKHETGTIEFPAQDQLVQAFNREENWIQLHFPRGWEKLITED